VAKEILADWRAVERDLKAAPVGSPEAAALRAELGRLHDEYQALVDEVLRMHQRTGRARQEPDAPASETDPAPGAPPERRR